MFPLLLSKGIRSKPASAAGYSAEPELSAWVTRVQGQGSDVTGSGVQTAVGNFIVGMKTDLLWDRAFRIGVFTGNNMNALKAPLVNTYGNVTDTISDPLLAKPGNYSANGFFGGVAGDMIMTGYKATVAMGYIEDDFSMGCYVRGTNYAGTVLMGLAVGGSDSIYLAHDASFLDGAAWGPAAIHAADANGEGFFLISRIASNDCRTYKNGAQIGATATGASGVVNTDFRFAVMDGTLNDVNWFPSGQTFCFYWIGLGLDATQEANLYTRVQTLQTALGRNV